jgi:hypothetical protein
MNTLLKLTSLFTLTTLAHATPVVADSLKKTKYVDEDTTTINVFVTNHADIAAELTEAYKREIAPKNSHAIAPHRTYNFTDENPFHFKSVVATHFPLSETFVYEAGDKACEFTYWIKATADRSTFDDFRVHHSGTGRSIGDEEADCSTFIHAAERHYPYNSAIEFTIK